MALGRSTDLSVDISGDATGYERAAASAERATARAQRAALDYDSSLAKLGADIARLEKQIEDDLAAALAKQHDAMDKTGKGMLVFGAAVATALGLAANEAMKWESAWAGVTKTVDGTPEQMAALEEQLRGLATTLPATHEEIAGIAEAAGQLGIQRDAVAGFTKTIVDLAETTNLTADEAATNMAQFANIMQTPQDEIDRLGASLVALGNAGASTEADILAMGMRIAGAGNQLGLTEGEVMGVANALASLGIEAEAGGSAISRQLIDMQVAVQDGGEILETYARTAGMTVGEFSRLFEEDAAGALAAFTEGLGRVKASGGDVFGVLTDLEITEIRQRDAVLRLAGSNDLLSDSLKLGNDAWAENTALLEEANERYATSESRVQVAQNALRDAAIDIGGVVLPAIAGLGDAVADMATFFGDIPDPVKAAVTIVAALAAAVALAGGAMLIAVPKIAAFRTAVAGLEAGALKTAGTRLSGMAGVLAGPWGFAVGATITALGIFATKQGDAARAVDELTASLDQQSGAITTSTRQLAFNELFDSGVLDAADKLGLSISDVLDASLKVPGAMQRVADANARFQADLQASADANGGAFDSDLAKLGTEWTKVKGAIGTGNETIDEARSRLNLMGKAGLVAADGTEVAGDAQKGATGAWEAGADAAGELTEEVKTLGEQMEEAAGNFLNEREAQRQVRDSLREIQKAIREYKKEHGGLKGAFKDGTASGDEFAGMLDGLAQDYQNQVDAVQRVTGSEKAARAQYRESRAALIDVATQLGMTRKEAEAYADEVLKIPKTAKTDVDLNSGDAERKIADYRDRLLSLDGKTVTSTVRTVYESIGSGRKGGGEYGIGMNADGGWIRGPGGPRDDQILRWLSNGEFVVNAADASRNGPLLEAINSGRDVAGPLGGREVRYGAPQTVMVAPSTAPRLSGAGGRSGRPQEIRGTLHIPGLGEGYIRGVVASETASDRSFDRAMAGRSYR